MKVVFKIQWDYDDARFSYYNHILVTSLEEWKKKVKEECLKNKNYLLPICKDDDFNDFEKWVDWCIDNFVYYDTCLIDNYDEKTE